jgi:DNA invertase Pin-like site-specific DNA recombinase
MASNKEQQKMNSKITSEHLNKVAVVYVRQSHPMAAMRNPESKRLQYGLLEKAKEYGFKKTKVIDEDLGHTASGVIVREGFNTLVGLVCSTEVGMVLCTEDARLARNGREWHHLIDLCALTGTLLMDPNDIYDPRLSNDRLLLGLKGAMAEFELSVIRQRLMRAIQAKAARGELRVKLPVGLLWTTEGKIEKDPDQRVQEAIALVFRKYTELGSANQVLRWFYNQNLTLPATGYGHSEVIRWSRPQYQKIIGILKNPLYAGAYAFGRTESRVAMVDGRAVKSIGHPKPQEQWTVLIVDHHLGYISWEEYERNQKLIAENAHMFKKDSRKAGRGGSSLLCGLLRCGRCGRMMSVVYKGLNNNVPRYYCCGGRRNHGAEWCISFGGLRPDEAVSSEILRVVDSYAIEAALKANELAMQKRDERRKMVLLELEQAHYEEKLSCRRYEAVDPDKRLVAAELEGRWEVAIQRVKELEGRLEQLDIVGESEVPIDRDSLLALADDLPSVWNAPAADIQIKQRIARILINEIIADVNTAANEIVLTIHWVGGRHSERRVCKNKSGQSNRWTDPDVKNVIRRMAGNWSNRNIALTLNRMGMKTGTGLTWNESRVRSLIHSWNLPTYDPSKADQSSVSLAKAASHLGISTTAVRGLIDRKILLARQVAQGAPWEISVSSLNSPETVNAVEAIINRANSSRTSKQSNNNLMIPGL